MNNLINSVINSNTLSRINSNYFLSSDSDSVNSNDCSSSVSPFPFEKELNQSKESFNNKQLCNYILYHILCKDNIIN